MKILHVNKFFDLHGGAENYMHQLMRRQEAQGHEAHALSTRSPNNLPSDDATRFVERYDYAKSDGPFRDARKAAAFLWNREAGRAMAETLRQLRPDVVHLHNIYHHLSSSVLAPIRVARIPCVQTLHDYKLACPNYKMFTEGAVCERCKGGRYIEAVKHRCLYASTAGNVLAAVEMGFTKLFQSYERTVRAFICPSQFMADKMAAWGEPPSKLTVIPNPVEVPETMAPRDQTYLLAVGRLSVEKGFETLIRAAAAAPGVEIRIAGIGPEESRLKTLATSLGAKVEFLGFKRRDDLAGLRRHAVALVVPSVWYENAPLAVLEAMADGLPVIASRIGGLPELVQDGVNGFLVLPQDPDGLAGALKKFAGLPAEQKTAMAEAGKRNVIERYTWERHLASLDALYASLGSRGRALT